MVVLAIDFDGVLRRLPGFVEWYVNFLRPDDLLARSKLFFLRRILAKIFMEYTPVVIDGEIVEYIKEHKPIRLILVSGRYSERQKKEVFRHTNHLHFDKIYFRENPKESEWKFKERILKREKVDIFIDDRKFVVKYLNKKGINALYVKQAHAKIVLRNE